MTKIAKLLVILLISAGIVSMGSLGIGAAATHPSDSESGNPPAAQAESEASVRCLSFGLCGEITSEALVDSLSEGGERLVFLCTSNGLYVLGLDGKLRHFLYSPFGVRFVALIDDITGDGTREVVVALADTQVPALRCYDGATWGKLWQFAPMSKVWEQHWVERQLAIGSLAVIEDGDSQSVIIASGRCVFSVNAEDGIERWRSSALHTPQKLAAVADINGDGTDEVFLATEDGYLCLLNGKTGEVRWQTRLPEVSSDGTVTQSTAGQILTLDREAGQVAVASSDRLVRLFDLKNRNVKWEVPFPTQEMSAPGPMALVPNATPDGQPGILVFYSSPTASASGGGTEAKPRMALLDAAGNNLWDEDTGAWYMKLNAGSYGGKRVIIEPTAEEIKLIDLADGKTVVTTIPVSTPDEWGADVRQIGENAFLLAGSLTAISSSGDVLWHYPRIADVKALPGNFVGDATQDVLFCAEWKNTYNYGYTPLTKERGIILTTGAPSGYQPEEPEVRLLKLMDGATGEIAWSYEVPLSDLKSSGGLKGLEVTADLVGNDGIPDIIGYREDTVFIFSGKDGTPSSLSAGVPVESLDVIQNGASGNAIAVGTADGLTIFDSTGTDLWTTTGAEWEKDENVKFTVLDDINSDNVSDLAVLSASKIVLLESQGNASAYQLHLTFSPETDCLFEYVQLVPDANGDGVRDLAYIQRKPGSQQQNQYTPPGCPVLVKRSPVGGEQLLRVEVPAQYPAIDLACGYFNGDGCVDSLICYNSSDTCGSTPSDAQTYVQNPGVELLVVSGRDGTTIRTHRVNQQNINWNGWGTLPPATNIGDVTGDGRDDLAWTFVDSVQSHSGYYGNQQRIEVYDVARDQSLGLVSATPVLREGAYSVGESTAVLPADVDADGRSEVLAAVPEPSTASHGQTTGYPAMVGSQYLAVMGVDSGERLAAFMGFSLGSASVFDTHQPGVLGIATTGGAYFLDTTAHLEVTSPANGASTGPIVKVRWEGTSEGDSVQVFVDGVRNYAGNDSGADLYLAHGKHEIVVRSVDDYGRILYGPSDLSAPVGIKVTPSPWRPILLVLCVFVLLVMMVLLFYARLHRMVRARRREVLQQKEHA